MKRLMSGLCYSTVLSIMCLTHLHGVVEEDGLTKCTKEQLMTFFPQQVVESVLVRANLSKDQAASIARELSQKDRELGKLVEDKAAKLESNPFKDLSQRDLAIKIYRETLYEVFAKVLKAHGVKSDDQIQSLLDEVQSAKSKLFIDCIRKQTTTSEVPAAPSALPAESQSPTATAAPPSI